MSPFPSRKARSKDLAFYYPGPIWHLGDRIKNLLLYFDGIALLVPPYMGDRLFSADRALISGLDKYHLLTILDPESMMTDNATKLLGRAMAGVVSSGALDRLAKLETLEFRLLSMTRMGDLGNRRIYESIFRELNKRGLAERTRDGVSVPMHPLVRNLILLLLAQILRRSLEHRGVFLHPATDQPEIHRALAELLGAESFTSAGHIVDMDMEVLNVDLSSIPLDEVMEFRKEFGAEFKSYASCKF